MSSSSKFHIEEIINRYKQQFPEAYEAVRKMTQMKRDLNPDEYGRLEGSEHRAILEMPEDLEASLLLELSDEDYQWYRSTPGTRWVAKRYPAFSLARSI